MLGYGGKRLASAALAVLGLGALAFATTQGTANAGEKPRAPHFTLPAGAPTPGADYKIRAAYKVVHGVQTYACTTNTDGTSTWATASTPEAQLAQYSGYGRIHHYAGPRWTSEWDGSTILGVVDTKVAKDGTIPWLLLHVSAHENTKPGELDKVAFVSRVNTSGGVGPTGACTPGTSKSVPYHADYVFWVPKA